MSAIQTPTKSKHVFTNSKIIKYAFVFIASSILTLAVALKLALIKDNSFANIYTNLVSITNDISGLVIAICAIIALQQLTIAKKSNQYSERRNAAEKAVEQCEVFKDDILGQANDLERAFREHDIPINSEDITIKQAIDYWKQWKEEITKYDLHKPVVALANSLELYSILVREKIADEEILFCPTAAAFLESCRNVMYHVYLSNYINKRSYTNLIYVYKKWNNRIKLEDTENDLRKLLAQSKEIET